VNKTSPRDLKKPMRLCLFQSAAVLLNLPGFLTWRSFLGRTMPLFAALGDCRTPALFSSMYLHSSQILSSLTYLNVAVVTFLPEGATDSVAKHGSPSMDFLQLANLLDNTPPCTLQYVFVTLHMFLHVIE